MFADEAEVSSVSLYLDVDFERKVLCGKVDLTVDKKKAEVTHVVSLVALLDLVYVGNLCSCN